ncbi:MAG: hypothetical protein AAF845_03725 [Bacteroidota bacterium]
MTPDDKAFAEAVIGRLCVGAQIDGVRFGPVLQLLITDHASGKPPLPGQVYLNLGSTWQLFSSRPSSFPEGEDALPDYEDEEALRILCDLREAEVVDVALADDAPDLILTLADGRVFFLNGRHEQYETWQLGLAYGRPDETWLVVACPGNGVAVWAPNSFTSVPGQ